MLIFFLKLTCIKKNFFFTKVLSKKIKFLDKFNLFYLNFLSFFLNKQFLKISFFENSLKNSRKKFSLKISLVCFRSIRVYFIINTPFNYFSRYLLINNILVYIEMFKKKKLRNKYTTKAPFFKKNLCKKKIFFKKKHSFRNFINFFKKNFFKKKLLISDTVINYYYMFFQTNYVISKINKNKFILKKFIFLKDLYSSDKNDFFTNDFSKKLIELQKQYVLKQKYFFFINTFLYNFLNFFLKKKLFFSLKKLNNFFKNHFNIFKEPFLFLKLKKKIKNFKSLNFIKTFYKIFYISLKLKDSLFFLKWFTLRIEDITFKKHKNYIHFFHSFLKIFYKNLFLKTKTLGVYFSISGKIGVTGDSKKRKIFFNYGMHSSSKKNLKLNLSRTQVKTKTGVMGISYNIFF